MMVSMIIDATVTSMTNTSSQGADAELDSSALSDGSDADAVLDMLESGCDCFTSGSMVDTSCDPDRPVSSTGRVSPPGISIGLCSHSGQGGR